MKILYPISIILYLMVCSCNNYTKEETRQNWKTYRITNDWLISAPKGFKIQEFPGIDSEIGSIYSKKDSINLKFESWRGAIGDDDYCNEINQKNRFENKIKGLKKEYGEENYTFVLEDINNNLALIVYPKNGQGDYLLEIHNCQTGSPLILEGIEMKNQKTILDIFKTLKFKPIGK